MTDDNDEEGGVKSWEEGRRYSRREIASFDLNTADGLKASDKYIRERYTENPDGSYSLLVWRGHVVRGIDDAKTYLRSIGLPDYSPIYRYGGTLHEEPPAQEVKKYSFISINDEVRKHGYAVDSLADWAARVLDAGTRLLKYAQQGNIELTAEWGVIFGGAAALWHVYRIEHRDAGPGRPKMKRHWADYIVATLPVVGTKEERWQRIPESQGVDEMEELHTPIGDLAYYRDGDKLIGILDGDDRHPRELKRTSFFKRHLKGR